MKKSNLLSSLLQFITDKITRCTKTPHSKDSQIISSQNLNDHQLFETLCQFIWIQGEPLPLIFDVNHEVYTKQGITLATLKHLETAGLIILEPQGFVKKGFGKHTRLFYCGRPTKIGFPNNENNYLDLGHVLLTKRGKELASTYIISRNQQFYQYVIQRWFEQGLILSSVQIERSHKTAPACDCSIKE